jgi:hypothetical protein
MWEPGPSLGLVDTEIGQAAMGVLGDPRRPALLVVEDHHADSAGLSVANRREHGRSNALDGRAQDLCDRADLAGWP